MGNKNKLILILIGLMVGLAVACTTGANETDGPPTFVPTPAASPTPSPTPTVVVPTQTPGPVVDKSPLQTELDLNRQLWESKAINGYHFEHRWICFCIQDFVTPVDVTVDGSEIVEVRYLDDEPHRRAPDAAQYYTIPGLFNLIQNAIDTGAYSLEAQYDAEFGYPTEVFIDYVSNIADEERGFSASNLEAE